MDLNMISTLMQMLSQNQNTQNNAQNGANSTADVKNKEGVASAFCAQNGLGERVQFDTQNTDKQSDIFAQLANASQNPILSLLGAMKGGKSDIASLLPLLGSLMKRGDNQTAKSSENNGNVQKNEPIEPKEEKKQEKIRCDLFSPIAFSGYAVTSLICALLKAIRECER